jgi:hypothetical protein
MTDLSTACRGLGLAFEVTHFAIPRQLFARFEEAGLGSESWRASQPPRVPPE